MKIQQRIWQIDEGTALCTEHSMGSLSEAAFIRGNGFGAMDKLVQGEDGEMTVEDDYRIEYLRDHIRQMEEAVMDGVD